jgi:NAD(P)H-nitrite reductase large subunit
MEGGDSMRHLIIGNGSAGVMAAEMIRRHAPQDAIVLIGNEPGPAYSRSMLPRLVSGDIDESGCYLRKDSDHFYKLRIEQRFARIGRIDTRASSVVTESGASFDYDHLLIATGASPRIPQIPGIRSPGVRTCWSMHDARKIIDMARPGSRVVLIGAGLVGCSLIDALVARKVHLDVIEQDEQMAASMMKPAAAKMLKSWCETKGIRVHTSTNVIAIDNFREGFRRHEHLVAHLSSGARLSADLVICATGSQPNVGFLKGSGIDCAQGVMVNPSMQTNVSGVYAAGDCAEVFDIESGRMVTAGVLPNALDQASCAALNMVGKAACQQRIRHISMLATMGLVTSSLGNWQGKLGGQWVETSDERNFTHVHLEFQKDVLIGANLVGMRQYVGMLRDLIHHRIALGVWKERLLEDPSRLKEAYTDCVRRRDFMDDRRKAREVTRGAGPAGREMPSLETIAAIAYRTIANAARRSPPTPSGSRW